MAHSKKSSIEQLDRDVMKILDEYAGNVEKNLISIIDDMARRGAAAVRAKAHEMLGGDRYWKSWTFSRVSDGRTSRFNFNAVIYSKMYRLVHLLEHGHANRTGGRTKAYPHVAPVEDELTRLYEEEVLRKL